MKKYPKLSKPNTKKNKTLIKLKIKLRNLRRSLKELKHKAGEIKTVLKWPTSPF